MYNIGQKIKELRKINDLTQEKLADYLCVSCQAVSKWECGVSSPDLSLIGPLTKLLRVSADELLGLDKPIADERHAELTAMIGETWKTAQDGDLEKRYQLLKTAIEEYPGDMKFLNDFAWATAMRSFSFEDNETYRTAQEEAIRLFARVIEDCSDRDIRCSAIGGIVQHLGFCGRYDEAKAYAELYPDDPPYRKEDIIGNSLEGEEREKHEHKMTRLALDQLLCRLDWQSEEGCQAIIDILKLFHPGGKYLHYHDFLSMSKRNLALIYAKRGETDRAIALLKEAKEHAYAVYEIDKNPKVYHYASPFFNKDKFNPADFFHTGDDSSVSAFHEFLERSEFDGMKRDKAFLELLEKGDVD